ncbi:MAG: methyltransferase family protein [Anaerolineales bacterium]
MISSLMIITATVVYAGVHSLLAYSGAKLWIRQRYGPGIEQWYRLAYNVFAVLSGLPILVLLYLLPDQPLYQIPFPWILLTALGQLVGVVIIVVGILQTDVWHFIGLRQIIQSDNHQKPEMVSRGLYSWVRHPLYTGGLLLIWLVPTMTLNLLTVFVLLTIYLVLGAKLEEKRLVEEFGDEYRAYQARVPMLLPVPRRKQ